jgi:hypothetical protein
MVCGGLWEKKGCSLVPRKCDLQWDELCARQAACDLLWVGGQQLGLFVTAAHSSTDISDCNTCFKDMFGDGNDCVHDDLGVLLAAQHRSHIASIRTAQATHIEHASICAKHQHPSATLEAAPVCLHGTDSNTMVRPACDTNTESNMLLS